MTFSSAQHLIDSIDAVDRNDLDDVIQSLADTDIVALYDATKDADGECTDLSSELGDRLEAAFTYLTEYHEGQGSTSYRALCRVSEVHSPGAGSKTLDIDGPSFPAYLRLCEASGDHLHVMIERYGSSPRPSYVRTALWAHPPAGGCISWQSAAGQLLSQVPNLPPLLQAGAVEEIARRVQTCGLVVIPFDLCDVGWVGEFAVCWAIAPIADRPEDNSRDWTRV